MRLLIPVLLSFPLWLLAAEEEIVFKSDVSLIRVDARVVDSANHPIGGLTIDDFVLYEEGKIQQIRNFATEDTPLDVLLLLDVSGSMRPQIARVAAASSEAVLALGKDDRVAIMVFDRQTRLRMPFRGNLDGVQRELERIIDEETFNGGTDINRGIQNAAAYVARNGRKEVRRAIVILTDDISERGRDVEGMIQALTRADVTMSALMAPDLMQTSGRRPYGGPSRRTGGGGGGGGWPGSGGGGWGGLGGIILGGPGGPMGGGGTPFPGGRGGSMGPAGTDEIARGSGGDSLPADQANALETTLSRLRQRYALYFYLPQDARPGQERNVRVELSAAARRRHPNADLGYRQVYLSPGGSAPQEDPSIISSRSPEPAVRNEPNSPPPAVPEEPRRGGWRRTTDEPVRQMPELRERPAATPANSPQPADNKGGWRKVQPGQEP